MAGLIEFLQHHNIEYREGGTHKHVRPGWVGVDCPRCGPHSKRFHAGIRGDVSGAACWRCGGLRVWDLLGELSGLAWHEARRAVFPLGQPLAAPWTAPGGAGHSEYPPGNRGRTGAFRPPRRGQTTVSAPGGGQAYPAQSFSGGRRVLSPPNLQACTGAYRRYLEGRGFDPDVIPPLWGVKATGPIGRLSWRLWIPIRLGDTVVSWTTRAIGKTDARYISAKPEQEVICHKHLLYGEDLAGQAIVVVEGPLDVWAIGPGAVAIMGLQTTQEQIERIGRHPLRAICCDSEPAALRRAEKLARVLQQYPGSTHLVELETGKDAAEAEQGELDELRQKFLFPLTHHGGAL